MRIILASKSKTRSDLLKNAGVDFICKASNIDERSVEDPLVSNGIAPDEIALALAEAKAMSVGNQNSNELILGCDQTLGLGNTRFHKPENMSDAKHQLLELSGKTHQLNSAIVIVQNQKLTWRHISTARMQMRKLSAGFIDRYIEEAGTRITDSVGGYQLENIGAQLFEEIQGDYFTVLGLPLLPLLGQLRKMGIMST
ncbi:MAG: Maf-like protein [Cohaesibacteraceae bacterium]|nr:Maf-like protein [Cohaesibacteraceae bacterium]MBL4875938.1 Maf-like protein [Cohaesibacteraceae bacterium]